MPFLADTLPTHLGIRLTEVSAERAVGEMPVHQGVRLPSGLVHTGAMLSLGDTVATFAAMAAKATGFDPARFPFAIGLSSQIVGNVQEGVLRAESVVTHPGRTLVIVETRVTSDAGKLLTLITTTHLIRGSG
jgi:1,4-dihydroxy-2-naphthoyl-CoA hydrolase